MPPRCVAADPPYIEAEDLLYNNIKCPFTTGGVAGVRAPYLLVPGTGNNGPQSWQEGYVQLLGKGTPYGLGYDGRSSLLPVKPTLIPWQSATSTSPRRC